MMNLGFIGAGNMGGAIIGGIVAAKSFCPDSIYVCDTNLNGDILNLGINKTCLADTVRKSDFIVLAVKPNILASVLEDIKKTETYSSKTFISIAAGYKIQSISDILGKVKIIRVMPNICLKSKEGMTVISSNDLCQEDDIKIAEKIFGSCGKTALVKESLIDSCTAINGSGPAYVFMFMEALADAAVKHGIDRETAYLLSAQTVLGSAKLMLETHLHPGILKDMVCSPGGTTIEAVSVLEQKGLRDAVISAVDECAKKAEDMSKIK